MSHNQIELTSVRLQADTLVFVSPETECKLVEVMESNSLEKLIQLLLRNLAAETGVIPTSSLIIYPLRGKYLP